MTPLAVPAHTREVPILLLAPVGRDAQLLHHALADRANEVHVLEDPQELEAALERHPAGVLILTQEGLTGSAMRKIARYTQAQAPWDELPILLLVDLPGHTVSALARFQFALPRARTLVLRRPLQQSELGAAIETMADSRLRQYAVRRHVERQDILRRELNHRVKNILATVQALHGLTATTAPDLDTFVDSVEGRLDAMAGVHQVLHEVDYEEAELLVIAEAVLARYRTTCSVAMDGDLTALQPEAAQALALVLHELATNASKYGALSRPGGRVRLSWKQSDGTLEARWVESDGPTVARPQRVGYGTRFIEMTLQSYGGTARFEYAGKGLQVTLAAPLDRLGSTSS